MQPYGQQQGGADPNAILNECREVDRALDQIDAQLDNLERTMQAQATSANPNTTEVTNLTTQVMAGYRALVARVKNIKSKPESGNPRNAPQVGKVDRRLKAVMNRYQNIEKKFRQDQQEAIKRQYRIVNPNATEQELQEAAVDGSADGVFAQAVSLSTLCLISGHSGLP